jgi:hypothetical protein
VLAAIGIRGSNSGPRRALVPSRPTSNRYRTHFLAISLSLSLSLSLSVSLSLSPSLSLPLSLALTLSISLSLARVYVYIVPYRDAVDRDGPYSVPLWDVYNKISPEILQIVQLDNHVVPHSYKNVPKLSCVFILLLKQIVKCTSSHIGTI